MKKKKIVTIAIVVISSIISVFASSETVNLEIKGYKVSHEQGTVEMVITDALTENLNPIENASKLYITKHLSDLLGELPTIPDFGRRVVFSYRVSGSMPGNFTINLTFTPLYLSGTVTNEAKKAINVYYSLQNENYVFLDSAGSESSTGDVINMDTDTIEHTKSGVAGIGDGFMTSLKLSTGWKVTSTSNDTCSLWIARGAVGMVVSKVNENYGYDYVAPGEYIGTVTVELISTN